MQVRETAMHYYLAHSEHARHTPKTVFAYEVLTLCAAPDRTKHSKRTTPEANETAVLLQGNCVMQHN